MRKRKLPDNDDDDDADPTEEEYRIQFSAEDARQIRILRRRCTRERQERSAVIEPVPVPAALLGNPLSGSEPKLAVNLTEQPEPMSVLQWFYSVEKDENVIAAFQEQLMKNMLQLGSIEGGKHLGPSSKCPPPTCSFDITNSFCSSPRKQPSASGDDGASEENRGGYEHHKILI
jgi:hypothetical protein